MSADLVARLLSCPPAVYDFSAVQTRSQRLEMIRSLPRAHVAPASDVLLRFIAAVDERPHLEREKMTLEQLMGWVTYPAGLEGPRAKPGDADDGQLASPSWALRVYSGPEGVLYDLWGIPIYYGRRGAAVLYPAGGPPVDVYSYADSQRLGLVAFTPLAPQFFEIAHWLTCLSKVRVRQRVSQKTLGSPTSVIASALSVESLLARVPTVYDFDLAQTSEQRRAAISALPTAEAAAISDIFERHIAFDIHRARVLSPEERRLEFFMAWTSDDPPDTTDDELRYYSADWRLRVFAGVAGRLYDFNGWSEGNEHGGAVFYPANGGPPVDVFANGNGRLTALHFEYLGPIARYAESREAPRDGGDDTADSDEFFDPQ